MPADKYIALVNGRKTEVSGTQVSTGASQAGDLVALDDNGRLDLSVMPTGVVPETKSVVTSEALTAGNEVNIYNNAGTPNVRKADATTVGKEATGFVLSSYASGATATVYLEGINNQKTGLTAGARLYLSVTAGNATATPPASSGNVLQFLGTALDSTSYNFEPDDAITLA